MNKIDINATAPPRAPDGKGSVGGGDSRAGRAGRAPAMAADIDHGGATLPLWRDAPPGPAQGPRCADPSHAGLSKKELIAAVARVKQSSLPNGAPRRDIGAATRDPDGPELRPDPGEWPPACCPADLAAISSATEQMRRAIGNRCRGGEEDARLTVRERRMLARADRVHYLAMAAMVGTPLLRAPAPVGSVALPGIRPPSRAECQRRCGTDGFCDPSDSLGCGGEHCAGRQFGPVRR